MKFENKSTDQSNLNAGFLSATLRYCSESIINFTIMFALVFFAFIHFFYLVYLPSLEVFSDLIMTAEQCLMMMVGKFNFSDMAKASPVLGTLMFFLYMIIVFFILLTMFVGIILDGFAAVRDDINKQSNEHEMVDFIVGRLRQWTGANKYFGIRKKVGLSQLFV
ncbi:hypothetical protein HELRODRAFT_87363 [Helobdella robusta]|uniref:Polycystin cation channel PKD1/PKD2 domain-containing protein n=1 Tax=Helobdella robusta TaxID=6412 RepID=T1G6P4_HELRO|nr:hypothetical protein HELRODRAFT_87363 [Helobdella robusta]ESN95042.1 hypothetical protein HELRODRAFT_87363 [Helobdella robusta]